jgi:hypothetical protein
MQTKMDLWQKSLHPVTTITGLFALICDGYHEVPYHPALL